MYIYVYINLSVCLPCHQELLLYLLQLVQALKYENFDEIREACEREKSSVVSHFSTAVSPPPLRQESSLSTASADR